MRIYKTFDYPPVLNSLKKISLYRFRNYDNIGFEFPSRVTCITGRNGCGKTNLLDAVYYLCYTKSYFTSFQQHCVQTGQDGFRVAGTFMTSVQDEEISCKWRGGKKEIFANDAEYEKPTDHIGRFSAVMIAPDDTELINGATEVRRKWLDSILGQVDRGYLERLLHYQRVLQQRNAWLKMQATSPDPGSETLDFYNAALSADGAYIYTARAAFINQFRPLLKDYYQKLSGGQEQVELNYTSKLSASPMQELLHQSLSHDLRLQRTTYGIHRDDLELSINGISLRQFGSQGQKKSFLFALKLAQYDYLSKIQGHLPILLLDDVFEKLDQSRMEALLSIISREGFGQVILTDTHPERVRQAFGNEPSLGFLAL